MCAENYNKRQRYSKFISKTAVSIFLISNHNNFRVECCLTKLLPYVLLENILIFQRWKWPAQGTGTVPIVSAHFRSPLAPVGTAENVRNEPIRLLTVNNSRKI